MNGHCPTDAPKKKFVDCSNVRKLMKKNIVEHLAIRLFYKLGLLVGRHPYKFLIIPIIITSALSAAIVTIDVRYEVYRFFTPTSSPSNDEFQAFVNFFNDPGGIFHFVLGVTAKDKGSLLRLEYREEIVDAYNYFQYNYTIKSNGKNYTFNDLQIHHKDDSYLPILLMKYYNTTKLPIKLTYPIAWIGDEQYYIADHIRNATVDPETHVLINYTLLFVVYNSARGNEGHSNLLRDWAISFLNLKDLPQFPNLHFCLYNEEAMAAEMIRNSASALPFIIMGFVSLAIFALIATASKNPVKSKSWECMSSLLAVGLATGSSFGILFAAGVPFIGTSTVTPILVLALGMDVTYITLRNWKSTNPSLSPEERLAETLGESGPSIVITTLTNVLSASIGCATNIISVYVLSLTVAVAVTILFLLQITLFPAVIYLGGLRESLNRHSVLCCITVTKKTHPNDPPIPTKQFTHMNKDWWFLCSEHLARILCTNYARLVIVISLLAYWATAIYGCYNVKLGLTPEKLLLPNSRLLEAMTIDKVTLTADVGLEVSVIVQSPPNFTNVSEANTFRAMVKELESLPGCVGYNTTALWLRSMDEQFTSFLEDGDKDTTSSFYENLADFLGYPIGKRWRRYIDGENINGTFIIKRFFFTMYFQYTRDWDKRTVYTHMWRDTADNYPQFGVAVWGNDNNNFVTDALESLISNAVQDIVITAVCMGVVCICFIPNIFNTICAIITVASISTGTFGYLALWKVPLDQISLMSFLISIGYSVDFTSHISYHYYTSHGINQQEKLTSALTSIGLPMLETGISTVLTVGCICFAQSYVELVFFKTIFLTVVLGLFHGIIVLPTFLAWIPLNCLEVLFRRKKAKGTTTNVEISNYPKH